MRSECHFFGTAFDVRAASSIVGGVGIALGDAAALARGFSGRPRFDPTADFNIFLLYKTLYFCEEFSHTIL